MASEPPPSSFDDSPEYQETGKQKILRKLREEPLVPLGTLLTCLAFYNAWKAMRRGDHVQVQRMFRARVGAQAFTVLAMVAGGAYYGQDRQKRKELIKLEGQQRAEERHDKWIKELEARDEEDKALKQTMQRRKDRAEQRKAEVAEKEASAEGATGADQTAQERQENSKVLSALSSTGGWFGSKKTEQPKPQDDKSSPEKPAK